MGVARVSVVWMSLDLLDSRLWAAIATKIPPVLVKLEHTSPVAALKAALLRDRDYLMGWHANLASATVLATWNTETPVKVRWALGQKAARQFISVLFAGDDERPEPITDAEVRSGVAPDPEKRARLEAAGIRVTDTPEESTNHDSAVAASSETPLSRIQASIAEAKTHESPLNGRKMLADMEFLMNRPGDLEAEVKRLRTKTRWQAGELRRLKTKARLAECAQSED